MLDFVKISTRKTKDYTEVYPKFLVKKPSDLMIRGGDFYAVWVEDRGLWSTDEDDVLRLIDEELITYTEEYSGSFEKPPRILHMWDSDSGMITSGISTARSKCEIHSFLSMRNLYFQMLRLRRTITPPRG